MKTRWFGVLTLLVACSGEGQVDAPRDSGVDGGWVRDGGPRDSGVRCGDGVCERLYEDRYSCPSDCRQIPDFCRDGTEGCECTSSFADGDVDFAQDDCDAELTCIPWTLLSGRTDFQVPSQTCVKRCAEDSDCGTTEDGDPRACIDMNVPDVSVSVGRVCVDRVAEIDRYCGGSRNFEVLVTARGARVKTRDEIVGCAGDAACLFNAFDTLNPDEGVCVKPCGRASDAECPPAFPYCNPLGVTVDTSTSGLCSVGRLGFGSLAMWSEDPDRGGLATYCDAAATTLETLDLNVIDIPAHLCVEACNEGGSDPDVACSSTDPHHAVVCRVLDADTGAGLCVHDVEDVFPERCEGEGVLGLGRATFAVQFGQSDPVPAAWCVDRHPPPLTMSTVDTNGEVTPGDDCGPGLDEFRCPAPAHCAADGEGGGRCLVGCAVGEDPSYCATTLDALGVATSSSTACRMARTSTVVGFCAG